MIFSKACEYGIKATIYIAKQSIKGQRSSLKGIAKEIDSPEAFTAKILQNLVKHGIIYSIKGATGGFEINIKSLSKIKLMEIVVAIDGPIDDKICVLGLKKCSETHPCPVHHKYKIIKKEILDLLNHTSLKEMANESEEGLTWLKL